MPSSPERLAPPPERASFPRTESSTRTASLVTAALLAWTLLWAWLLRSPSAISWHFVTEGTRALFSTSGLHLYADHPELQIGPLTFVLAAPFTLLPAATGRALAQVAMALAGPASLAVLAGAVPRDAGSTGRRHLRVLLAGLVLTPAWIVLAVRWAHPDDVLAGFFAVVALRAVTRGRASLAGLAIAAAAAAKPWAIGAAPMLLALGRPGSWREFRRAGAVAAVGLLMAWGPFVLADSGTLTALRPPVGVADASALRLFGYTGDVVPSWVRSAQLVLAPAVALATLRRRRWPAALLVAIAVRLALDPQVIAYYAGTAVLAAVAVDLLLARWLLPWTALVTAGVMWQPFVADFAHRFATAHGVALWWFRHQQVVGVLHLVWSVAVVVVILLAPARWLRPYPASPPPAVADR